MAAESKVEFQLQQQPNRFPVWTRMCSAWEIEAAAVSTTGFGIESTILKHINVAWSLDQATFFRPPGKWFEVVFSYPLQAVFFVQQAEHPVLCYGVNNVTH